MHGVESGFATEDVGFGRVHPLGPFEDLPEGIEQEIDGDADVGGDEVVAKEGLEGVEAVKQDDHGEKGEGEVGRIGLKVGAENQSAPVHALSLQRFVELDVRNGDADPGEQAGDGGQVLEPLEHLGGARRATQISQQGDGCRHQHANVRDSSADGVSSYERGKMPSESVIPLGTFQQNLRGLAILRQREQVSTPGVEKGVGG